MDEEQKNDAQSDILNAAKKVFFVKGYKGATMRDIAQEAGVNLAMVNYYFRSKDKLFDMIFFEAASMLFAKIEGMLSTSMSIFEKIEAIVGIYIDAITSNPLIPSFVFAELSRGSDRFLNEFEGFKKIGRVFGGLDEQIEKEVKQGIIIPIKAYELYLNVVSLAVFPYVAKPIVDYIVENSNISQEEYEEFLKNRKKMISKFIIDAIKVK